MKFFFICLLPALFTMSHFSCGPAKNIKSISSRILTIEFDDQLHSRVRANLHNARPFMNNFQPAEYLILADTVVADFKFISSNKKDFKDDLGSGKFLLLSGLSDGVTDRLQKDIAVKIYDDFPGMAVFTLRYINVDSVPVMLKGWVNNAYHLTGDKKVETPFWSFQSGSYESRPDWVLPLKPGFYQENYMGMNASDYGGGIPVSDVWRKDAGLAVGHLETIPKLVSLPVQMDSATLEAGVAVKSMQETTLQPGDTLKTFTTFVAVHKGDYFTVLAEFSRFMQIKGVRTREYPDTAYEPVWCAWGYERNFKVKDVLGTLPKVRDLGYKWAVLDDGWQTAEGDWYLNRKKFPRGDVDMKAFVDEIHKQGLKAKLWWAPLAMDPGTDLHRNHPDLLLINKNGKTQDISWWDSYYLCPAYEGTMDYTRKLVQKFIGEWGYDGLKIDGQHLNAVPSCYNPVHHHAYPEESVEKLSQFYQMIYETATAIKPDAVVEICPCGTACSFYNMAWINQPVSSDPTSSWQIRLKGKTYKALMGASVPYYGDHVELSDGMSDFASTVGVGGVIGSKFVWPPGIYYNAETGDVSLTPAKEKEWKKWIDIYNKNELPKGTYRGELYDIGFDRPETHVIEKDGALYYAFYAPNWQGKIELRGLQSKKYNVVDYVNNVQYGSVEGPTALLDVVFSGSLLLKAVAE